MSLFSVSQLVNDMEAYSQDMKALSLIEGL